VTCAISASSVPARLAARIASAKASLPALRGRGLSSPRSSPTSALAGRPPSSFGSASYGRSASRAAELAERDPDEHAGHGDQRQREADECPRQQLDGLRLFLRVGVQLGGLIHRPLMAMMRRRCISACAALSPPEPMPLSSQSMISSSDFALSCWGSNATRAKPKGTEALEGASLTRPLLLIHGRAGDNVVVAHPLRISAALLAAGRER
jgi:hypothetical protein